MLPKWLTCQVLVATLFCCNATVKAQSGPKPDAGGNGYTLRLPVDEVVLTFNATDASGLPINDLKLAEIRLWDNGAVPRRIVEFGELVNRPIRAGVLLDTSESMQTVLPQNRAIVAMFLHHLFRQKSDEAFVVEFGYASKLIQPWTGDVSLLDAGMREARQSAKMPGGTALFNAVYQACSSSFGNVDPTATGNFILLFSDGEDNAGLTSPDEAARACQRSNAQVFAFVAAEKQEQVSTGPRTLRELAAKTGGQVFLSDGSEATMSEVLAAIESRMRNQYRIVYNPVSFKHDGAFHEIVLQPPDRVSRIELRTGYFAPSK